MASGVGDEGDEEILDLSEFQDSKLRRGVTVLVCLAGRLCTKRQYNTFALMEVMKKTFRPKGKMTIREWGLLIFLFDSSEDREWVVQNQLWHFDNSLFTVKSLSWMEQLSSISLTKASFWVRVLDLP
ncbi:hypothetical protein ACS0TY_021929 [Phlomoides rotata]